jgi:hypothetical protein
MEGDLIGQLHGAAGDPGLWPNVAPGIAAELGSPGTALVVQIVEKHPCGCRDPQASLTMRPGNMKRSTPIRSLPV